MCLGGELLFWEAWQNHIVKCEGMKFCKILDFNVKVKDDKSEFLPIITDKCEDEQLIRDNGVVRSPIFMSSLNT